MRADGSHSCWAMALANALSCRVECVRPSSGLDHSGWAGIIEANEQVTFAPLSCDRYPPAGHPLPDLPPHRGVPARQPQRGPDRALPPGPSRSARRPFPVALRRLPALGTVASADCPRTPCTSRAGERQQSRSVATLRKGPHIEPPLRAGDVIVSAISGDAQNGRSDIPLSSSRHASARVSFMVRNTPSRAEVGGERLRLSSWRALLRRHEP